MTYCDGCGLPRTDCKAQRCQRCNYELDGLLIGETCCPACRPWLDLLTDDGSRWGRAQVTIVSRYPRGPFPTLETA